MAGEVSVSDKPLVGIGLKLLSVGLLLASASLIKAAGQLPPGEMVFFRSLFAFPPILLFLWWRGELRVGLKTDRPFWHLGRGLMNVGGMLFGFFALTVLPLPEAVAIGFTMPLLTVLFGAVFLKEQVRLFRWTAVLVGFIGVAVITYPRLTVFTEGFDNVDLAAYGVIASLIGAVFGAAASLLVRTMVKTERSSTIVIYASITSTLVALSTIMFGWEPLSWEQAVMLILVGVFGGIGQVVLTEAFRFADVSVVAPFDYASLIFAIAIGYFLFGDVPTAPMLIGSAVVTAAGIAIILREHWLGLERGKARAVSPKI